jgi:adenylate cyclase
MLDRVMRRMYERLGSRYKYVLLLGEGGASVVVALLTIGIIASYYGPSAGDVALILAAGGGFTMLGVVFGTARAQPMLDSIVAWHDSTSPTEAETVAAWESATTFTLRQYQRDSPRVNLIAIVPTTVVVVLVLHLKWDDVLAVLLACVVPAAYGTVLSYSVGELLMRPVCQDIAAKLPDEFAFVRRGLPVRKRLKIGLPTYTAFTGLAVAALMSGGGGSGRLALSVLISIGVGIALSHELTLLLTQAITEPISDVRRALARIRAGDFTARVPVVSSDELGELSNDFNLMARGLEEREQMREAFGTYMDKEVAQIILSGQFPEGGVEVDVSIMFCDVRGFTSYAESADATEVVAALNALFSVMVPIVDKHGGHVDKFLGDGMLAVFGAPESYADHADRAVAAALEIVAAVNHSHSSLRIGVGVNSGRVVAGSIGGAGRLNFSVIGDAVNVAARVEAATRQTGDDVLITAATRDKLTRALQLVSRGTVPLKGKSEPVEVLGCVGAGEALPAGDERLRAQQA